MRMTAIILALISLLFFAGCVHNEPAPVGVVGTLNDFQRDYFERESAPEYRTYSSGLLYNTTNLVIFNESLTLGTVAKSLAHSDVTGVILFNKTSAAVIGSGNYTVNYQTGTITYLNGSMPYNNTAVGVNYSFYNKVLINCTPTEIDSGTIESFIQELKFISLGADRRVQLWIGSYVVNSSDASAIDANNILGKGWYVENVTDSDTIRFGKPIFASDEQFALRIEDAPATNATPVLVNVLCKYRVK